MALVVFFISCTIWVPGADPGFQVRGGGGGALKKIAPSGGRRENFCGISCEKSRFYAKKIIFPILGEAHTGCASPLDLPLGSIIVCSILEEIIFTFSHWVCNFFSLKWWQSLIFDQLHQWCNGLHACLKTGR